MSSTSIRIFLVSDGDEIIRVPNTKFDRILKGSFAEKIDIFSGKRVLQPVDNRMCWSIACLFIDKLYRKKGVSSTELLRAASEYAKSQSAELVEGYPVEPKSGKDIPPAFAWTGIPSAFIRAGFKEILRRSPTRPIMRKELK